MCSEEAQTFGFILKLCLGLFMTMWWQQNICVGVSFYPPVTHFAVRGMNSYIGVCFILPNIFLVFLQEQKNLKAAKCFISLESRHFQQQQMGYYTISRFGWISSPTWIWSRFSFNEMNFLSGVDFGLFLGMMGDFCIYFMYRR